MAQRSPTVREEYEELPPHDQLALDAASLATGDAWTSNFHKNFAWQAERADELVAILRAQAQHVIQISIADQQQDTKEAIDFVIEIRGGTVAARIRSWESTTATTRYRDLTIRTRSLGGGRTEIDKLRDGYVDFYLNAWCGPDGHIREWAFFDVHAMRRAGTLDRPRREIPNGDGTFFYAIPLQELEEDGAVIIAYVEGYPCPNAA